MPSVFFVSVSCWLRGLCLLSKVSPWRNDPSERAARHRQRVPALSSEGKLCCLLCVSCLKSRRRRSRPRCSPLILRCCLPGVARSCLYKCYFISGPLCRCSVRLTLLSCKHITQEFLLKQSVSLNRIHVNKLLGLFLLPRYFEK